MNALTGLEKCFVWLLQTSWQAAVLAGTIMLAQFLFRKRLSPAWRHGLWFLLLVRLVMPMTPTCALSIFNLTKVPRMQNGLAPAESTTPKQENISFVGALSKSPENLPPRIHEVQVENETALQPIVAAPLPASSSPPAVARPVKKMDLFGIAALVWLVGAFVLAVRFLWLNRRFCRRLNAFNQVEDESFKEILGQCVRSLGFKSKVEVLETEEVESPAVYGVWRKRLLLPTGLIEELTPAELRHVLLHELAHLKRCDPELNCLVVALQILHWFNPILWFAFSRMRGDRELATDELALKHTQADERQIYGETILKVLEQLNSGARLPGLVGIGESKAQIVERIREIARGTTAPRWRWLAYAVAVVIAGVALTSAREEQQTGVDLLKKYPTTLTAGDAAPSRARPWRFSESDIFRLSSFKLEVGKELRVEAGESDLGIAHCSDGAVWAVLIPRQEGTLRSSVATNEEKAMHVWLRFHPSVIGRLFPPESVSTAGRRSLEERMRAIAEAKFKSSWHAGNNAMIPEPKDLTVDVDTKEGPRRFFAVDTDAKTAQYWEAFADRSFKQGNDFADVAEADTNLASVVSVTPANGAQNVELNQELRIRFDRPMNPYKLKLEWATGGFQPNGSIQVTEDRKEFIIPLSLMPGQEQTLTINHDPGREMWVRMGKKGKPEPSPFDPGGFMDLKGAKANEFRWTFSTKELPVDENAPKPRVLNVSPASGATTPVLTFVEITFDEPMRLPEQGFPYQETRPFMAGPTLIPSFDYDSNLHRFTFPAVLRSDDDVRLTLKGFYSSQGVASDPIVLHYQTGTEGLDPKFVARTKAASKDPRLEKLFTSMKQARLALTSGIETVQTIHLGMSKNAFNSIEAQTATFKWARTGKAYADITGPMMTPGVFILGSDGVNCWLYSENEKGEKRLDQTPVSVTEQQVSLADPFELTKRSVLEVLDAEGSILASDGSLEGHPCYRVQKWEVNQEPMISASQTQWWIDAETFLPKQMVNYSGNWCQVVRFDYKDLNQPLPEVAFQPPAAPTSDTHPLFFDKEPGSGEHRFLLINDGSGGRMSGRLGWHGPGGTTSSGLN